MNAATPLTATTSLIQLDDLKKVFYTDEVETHALSGVHVDIMKGDYLSKTSTRRSARRSATRRSGSSSRRST